jgi:saccharopine dehydrogenase-like NADP-dependent oxidoreductase
MTTGGAKKVLVLGAGAQGNVVAWVLSRAGDVGTVVLADVDARRAEETAAGIGGGVRAARADARDTDGLTTMLRQGGFDLVVMTAIPDFIPQVMRAALRAGVNYLDLTSILLHEKDGLPIEQFAEAEAWTDSGRTAFVNGGSAPGLTNIMAREAVEGLDTVDAVRIRDYSIVRCDEFVTLWSPRVFLIDCATPPLVWEDGPKRVPIFSGEEEYEFPPPVGRRGKVYHHAHEEPATIPLFVGKPVPYCDYKIGDPDIDTWRFIVERLGLMDERPIEVDGARVSPREVLLRKMPPTLSPARLKALVEAGRLDGCTMVLSEATGTKNGRKVRVIFWTESPVMRDAGGVVPGASDISLLTSVPAATFALMLLRGRIGRSGVVLPETLGAAERAEFREGIGRFGIRIMSRTEPVAG